MVSAVRQFAASHTWLCSRLVTETVEYSQQEAGEYGNVTATVPVLYCLYTGRKGGSTVSRYSAGSRLTSPADTVALGGKLHCTVVRSRTTSTYLPPAQIRGTVKLIWGITTAVNASQTKISGESSRRENRKIAARSKSFPPQFSFGCWRWR